MKANAPEKLYISSKQRPDKEIFYGTCTKVESNDIEYTRTDAFIEKAYTYLNEKCRRFILTAKDIDDFINYMKEE